MHEASVGAFSSNYDRAVELYHYIKGGKVDYGAAHAAKTGHDRYGKVYQGLCQIGSQVKDSLNRSQYGRSNDTSA